jgi:DNA replication and repair protein RecF
LRLLERLVPAISASYASLATDARPVDGEYTSDWAGGVLTPADADDLEPRFRAAIADRRRAEIDRGLTLVGPHRDELRLTIGGLDARYQASQGEQRTLALALRLAGHATVRELAGAAPVLLLDDVFSELDADRSAALVQNLPAGQTLVSTAGALPPEVVAERTLIVRDGTVEPGS